MHRIGEISARTGIKFEPANPSDLKTALAEIRDVVQESRNSLSRALNIPSATGQTLAEAFDAYETSVREKNTDPTGTLLPWAKTKLDQITSIRRYLSDERFGGRNFLSLDLGELQLESVR